MIVRVGEPNRPNFQLRKGEEGVSVFVPDQVDPPLTDLEILDAFRIGSVLIPRTDEEVRAKGLEIEPIEGSDLLPDRLRRAHAEIRPGISMTRREFKQALDELE